MNIFKKLYQAKKREIEMKQGKHGIVQKYTAIGLTFLFYYWKALFIPGKEYLFGFLIPFTVVVVFSFLKEIKKEKKQKPIDYSFKKDFPDED